MPAKPALRTELLFYLSFLAAAALLIGVATMLVATSFAPEQTFALVMLLVALEVAVFVVFGRYLVNRLVLWPLERLVATADAVADGDLGRRAPDAETRDFATLAERLNRMTDHLLDAQGQLVRSEKLASIGRLAAGIAHEVGNPLGAIGTYVEVLRRRGADPEVISGVTRELDRLDRIVRGLLDYARPQEESLAPLDAGADARTRPSPGAGGREPGPERGGRRGRWRRDSRGSSLGLRIQARLAQTGERSAADHVSTPPRESPRPDRLRRRPAGGAPVRSGLGARGTPRGS